MAYAAALGAVGRKTVGVQVPLSAPLDIELKVAKVATHPLRYKVPLELPPPFYTIS
jgi:hypothetical protein